MNIVEKAEKALEYVKNNESSNKIYELQIAAGTLGKYLAALGSRQNYARHYTNLLHSAVPVLLSLASHNSAEMRLAGDEALNRAIVGGLPFHCFKTNIILQNNVDPGKNARWNRAIFNRICLGETWLRPGMGRIRLQAQNLIPKLSIIVKQTEDIPLIIEALESNLPRILKCLADYTSDEEILELCTALCSRAESGEAAVRRTASQCVGHVCAHRLTLITYILDTMYDKLWPLCTDNNTVLGWFSIMKAVLQINDISKLDENNLFTVRDYMELYNLFLVYIERSNTEHNIQNCVMECLSVLLSQSRGAYRQLLVEKHTISVDLNRRLVRQAPSNRVSRLWSDVNPSDDDESERSVSQTPAFSCDDVSIRTPESPLSEYESPPTAEEVNEALQRLKELDADSQHSDQDAEPESEAAPDNADHVDEQVFIGSLADKDVPLKYCTRLLVSKFLFSGKTGLLISDRLIRVSVKCQALSCLAEIVSIYPQAVVLFIDAQIAHNLSGSSDGSEAKVNQQEFIIEKNVCFLESSTESLNQQLMLLNQNLECMTLSMLQKQYEKCKQNLEKSFDSLDNKTSLDVHSSILDSTSKNDSVTNNPVKMETSNATSSGTSVCPMSISTDHLSSSGDLDIGLQIDQNKNAEQSEAETKPKPQLTSTEQTTSKEGLEESILYLIYMRAVTHCDPLIRGRARVVIGRYLTAVLKKNKDVKWLIEGTGSILKKLVVCLIEGAQTPSPTCSVPCIQILSNVLESLIHSERKNTLAPIILSELSGVETDPYWLVRVTLCSLYEKIDYLRLFLVLPEYRIRSRLIMDTLYRLLADDDQRVRAAASKAIANITPTVYLSIKESKHSIVNKLANQETERYVLNAATPSLDKMRNMYFYRDLPEQILYGITIDNMDGLRMVVGEIMTFLMESSCKNFSFGLIECLHGICKLWSPWVHQAAYIDQGILNFMVGKLQYTTLPVSQRSLVNDICAMVYSVEIHALLQSSHQTESKTLPTLPYVAALHGVVMKCLNVISHVVEELIVPPTSYIPGTPVRKNESRRLDDDKPRRRAQFVGNFYSDTIHVSLYDDLKATYSNYKVSLDQKTSIFYNFIQSTLNCLSVQLELCTEKEFGPLTEEILHYLRVIMPHSPQKAVFCVTQLLKCLFSTNMMNHYIDYLYIAPKYKSKDSVDFFEDILQVNDVNRTMILTNENDRNSGQKLSLSTKNPKLIEERELLLNMENFNRNKIDKNWSTNKEELTRYIKMFEPAVIQSLKSYTTQHDITVQCTVLALLDQLLTLRVNYCMLDKDHVFLGYVIKQLDLIEHHEIPDCDPLVTSILMFLLQLCSSKHHTKQIIELPKIIHLCECVVAGGAGSSWSGLSPLSLGVFLPPPPALAGPMRQEAMATREVTFNMLQKNMNHPRVIETVTCVLAISQQHPEMYYRWSELACDTLLNLMMHDSIEYSEKRDVDAVERLVHSIYRDVVIEQTRVEAALKILLKAAPDESAPPIRRVRYLINILVAATRIFPLIPEREIILTVEYVMESASTWASCFTTGGSWDPLFAEAVPLRAPVLLARILLRGMASSILLLKDTDMELARVTAVNFVVAVKHIFHAKEASLFKTLATTAQSLLQDELSGLNTGLYSPSDNLPLDLLHSICVEKRYEIPLLTTHWAHFLTRLNIFYDRFWRDVNGFSRNSPLGLDNVHLQPVDTDMVQVGCLLAFVEHCSDWDARKWSERVFVCARGGTAVFARRPPLLDKLLAYSVSAKILLNATTLIKDKIQGEFSLRVLSSLSSITEQANDALVLFICRVLDNLQPAVKKRYVDLAVSKCRDLSIRTETHENIQSAHDILVQNKLHLMYPRLYGLLRRLLPNEEEISVCEPNLFEQNDKQWMIKYAQYRCSIPLTQRDIHSEYDLAFYLTKLSKEHLDTVLKNNNFDIQILNQLYKIIVKKYIEDLIKIIYEHDKNEIEKENKRKEKDTKKKIKSQIDTNKITMSGIQVFKKSDKENNKSQFFIPITEGSIEKKDSEDQDEEIPLPNLPHAWNVASSTLENHIHTFVNCKLFILSEYKPRFYSLLKAIDGLLTSINKLVEFTATIPTATSKCLKHLLPQTLAKQLSEFLVIALQFTSLMLTEEGYNCVYTDLVLRVVSGSLKLNDVWGCLNEYACEGMRYTVVTTLYSILVFLLQDTKPIKLRESLKGETGNPNSVYVDVCNKLVTMIQFIENNYYRTTVVSSRILTGSHRKKLKQALFCIGRFNDLWSVAVFPPCLWSTVPPSCDAYYKSILLPLDELKECSVLEQYLFRISEVGWSSRAQFEQAWVCCIGGCGPCAALPVLLSPLPRVAAPSRLLHSVWDVLTDLPVPGYYVDYWTHVAGIKKSHDWRTRMFVRYVQDSVQVDLDSCVQLLLDLVEQATDEQRDIETCIRCLFWSFPALRSNSHLTAISSLLPVNLPVPSLIRVRTLCDVILSPQTVHGPSLRDLTSPWAPTRIAALKSNMLLLENGRLNGEMTVAVKEYVYGVVQKQTGSLYEQEMCWRFLLKLVELGDVDLVNTAVQFVTTNPNHYCTGVVLKIINLLLLHNVLSKDFKYSIIDKLMESIDKFNESDSLRILVLFMFSAVSEQSYFTGSTTSDSEIDPELVIRGISGIESATKLLKSSVRTRTVTAEALLTIVSNSLPPPAVLSRIMNLISIGDKSYISTACYILSGLINRAKTTDSLSAVVEWCLATANLLPKELLLGVMALLSSTSSDSDLVKQTVPLCVDLIRHSLSCNTVTDSIDSELEIEAFLKVNEIMFLNSVVCESGLDKQYLGSIKHLCIENEYLYELYKCLCNVLG